MLQERGRGSGSRSSARTTRPRPGGCSTSPAASASPTPGSAGEERGGGRALLRRSTPAELPLVRLPGGGELRRPSNGQLSRALGIGLELEQREEVDLLDPRRRPGRTRRRGLRRLGGPRHPGPRVHRARRPGRHLAADRELPRLPGRDQRHRADQPRDHPGAQVRRPHRDALPGRSLSSPAPIATWSGFEEGNEVAARAVLLSTGAEYRRLPVDGLEEYEGISVFYAAGPPEAQLCGGQRVGVDRRRQLRRRRRRLARPRRRPGHPAAPPRRPRARRCRSYLIEELDRYGVAVRDRSEVDALHGSEGRLEASDAHRRRPSCPSPTSSSSSAPRPAPSGSARRSPAIPRASSSPAPRRVPKACSKPACPASTPRATSAPARSSAARPRSARAPPSSASSTSTSRPVRPLALGDRATLARREPGDGGPGDLSVKWTDKSPGLRPTETASVLNALVSLR